MLGCFKLTDELPVPGLHSDTDISKRLTAARTAGRLRHKGFIQSLNWGRPELNFISLKGEIIGDYLDRKQMSKSKQYGLI